LIRLELALESTGNKTMQLIAVRPVMRRADSRGSCGYKTGMSSCYKTTQAVLR